MQFFKISVYIIVLFFITPFSLATDVDSESFDEIPSVQQTIEKSFSQYKRALENAILNQDKEPKFFYETPTLEKIEADLLEYRDALAQAVLNKDKEAIEIFTNIPNIYLTGGLSTHPELIPIIIEKFNALSNEDKNAIAQSLLSLGDKTALEKLHYPAPKKEKLLSIKDIDAIDLETLRAGKQVKTIPKNVDYLWTAFHATGDDKYILTILRYLNDEPKEVKNLASELLNRMQLEHNMTASDTPEKNNIADDSDIQATIKKLAKERKEPNFADRVTTYEAVLISLAIQRSNHAIDTRVQALLKAHPELELS